MISVIVTTYNGEKYILDQLESIRVQSREVDEVLICDDQSTDGTEIICTEFIRKYNLSNWKFIRNTERLGYYKNFMNGLRMLSGDILILSDQDDIWCDNKVEMIEKVMNNNQEILSLTTTFSRFDNQGIILNPHVVHPHSKRNGLTKISWRDFFVFHTYLGMSMAIKKSLLEQVETENKNNITHDIVLNMYAVRVNGLYHLDQVLTKRRSYNESTSNHKIQTEIDKLYQGNAQLHYLSRKIQLLEPEQFGFLNDDFSKLMLKFRKNYITRYEYILNKRKLAWLKNAVHLYYYENVKHYMKDFFAICK